MHRRLPDRSTLQKYLSRLSFSLTIMREFQMEDGCCFVIYCGVVQCGRCIWESLFQGSPCHREDPIVHVFKNLPLKTLSPQHVQPLLPQHPIIAILCQCESKLMLLMSFKALVLAQWIYWLYTEVLIKHHSLRGGLSTCSTGLWFHSWE